MKSVYIALAVWNGLMATLPPYNGINAACLIMAVVCLGIAASGTVQ